MNGDLSNCNHFKAHLQTNNNNETRRFLTEKNNLSLSHITSKLLALFPVLQDKNFTIYWKDEDSDEISIKSEEEWNIFLTCSRIKGLHYVRDIYVTYQRSKSSSDKDMHIYMSLPDLSMAPGCSKSEKPIHPGVVCDSCENNIVGTRYKCLVCEDFDLCANCEKLGLHSQHFMVRIVRPELWNRHWGSRFSKDLFRQIKKTTKLEGHHRRHSHGHHEKRSCPVKDDKVSWIDLFAQVMNNWGKVINDESEEEVAGLLNQTKNQPETNPETHPEEKKPSEKMGAEKENKTEKSKEENTKGEKQNEKMELDSQAEGKKSESNKIYPKLPEKSAEMDDEDWAMVNDDSSNSQTRPASPRGSETSGSTEERVDSSRSPQLLQALQRMRETGFNNELMAEIVELWLQNKSK